MYWRLWYDTGGSCRRENETKLRNGKPKQIEVEHWRGCGENPSANYARIWNNVGRTVAMYSFLKEPSLYLAPIKTSIQGVSHE